MATKFLSQDEKDAVGIINRQLTLCEATPVGEGAAPATPPAPAGATGSGGAAATAPTSNATVASEGSETPATEASASPSSPETATGEATDAASGSEALGLMDGLKIVARNGEADASREERLSAGQAPVIFDTADSPACTECGSIMVRNGSCYKCINCGATSGCS